MIDSTLKNANILIVDDKQDNIDILTGLLEITGYINIKTTTDSRKVVDLFIDFKPDIILLDLQMPHFTGYQVMEQLKSLLPDNSYIPILVLTADLTTEAKQLALSGGASDFLTKPYDLIEVDLRIKNLLKVYYSHQFLENQNKYLDEIVRERTKELEKTNIELSYAKYNAEEMSKLQSYFLSNVSHEMRTPLISILGFSEILVEELKNPEHIENAKYILESGKHLQNTINNILSFHELEKKKTVLSIQRFELRNLIKKIIKPYKADATNKGLKFNLNLCEHDIWIQSDSKLLKNIIENILDNALKFTNNGIISINVDLQSDTPNSYAEITILDTGVGINPNKIKNILEPFRQESEGLSRSFEGMGLGLSIAKQLIDALNGDIKIESAVGEGTTVILNFPAIDSDQDFTNRIDLKKTSLNMNYLSPTNGMPSVLLVEDNKDIRILFHKYLEDIFSVGEAANGVTAIAMAELLTYDIILMDINLGAGIDGIETFHRIRKLPNCKHIPIIAVTAYGSELDRKKFSEHGFNGFMEKLVDRKNLISTIKNLIEQRQL